MIPEIVLKNNVKIPQLGLGTWQLKRKKCTETVKKALAMGYRHIDTADYYGNHKEIKEGIEDFPREKLWITSKIWRNALKKEKVISECERFLEEVGTDYLDMLLIHWPNPKIDMEKTFLGMKELVEDGKVRNIGVSNFTTRHIEEAMEISELPIITNQIEFHPFLYQKDLLEFCDSKQIVITAYSPIARGKVMKNEVLREIGEKHGKTPAQVSLRWLIQHGTIPIPKSSSEEHLRENMEVFDFQLGMNEMERIDSLPQKRLIDPGFADFGD